MVRLFIYNVLVVATNGSTEKRKWKEHSSVRFCCRKILNKPTKQQIKHLENPKVSRFTTLFVHSNAQVNPPHCVITIDNNNANTGVSVMTRKLKILWSCNLAVMLLQLCYFYYFLFTPHYY